MSIQTRIIILISGLLISNSAIFAGDTTTAESAPETSQTRAAKAAKFIESTPPGTNRRLFALKGYCEMESQHDLQSAIVAAGRVQQLAQELGKEDFLVVSLMQESFFRLLAEGHEASNVAYDKAMELIRSREFSAEVRSKLLTIRLMRSRYLSQSDEWVRLNQELQQIDTDGFEHRYRKLYVASHANQINVLRQASFEELIKECGDNPYTLTRIEYLRYQATRSEMPDNEKLLILKTMLKTSLEHRTHAFTARIALDINHTLRRVGRFEEANTYCNKAVNANKRLKSVVGLAEAYTTKADTVSGFNLTKADEIARLALKTAERTGLPYAIERARLAAMRVAMAADQPQRVRKFAALVASETRPVSMTEQDQLITQKLATVTGARDRALSQVDDALSQVDDAKTQVSRWQIFTFTACSMLLGCLGVFLMFSRRRILKVNEQLRLEKKVNEQNHRLRERLERKIAHSERVESLGVLAGGVAHDFNNLLMGVMSNTEVLKLKGEDEAVRGHCIEAIMQSTEVAADLSRKMLAYAGGQTAVKVSTDLNQLVRDMIPLAKSAFGYEHELNFHPDTEPAYTAIDVAQVEQILLNLLTNAVTAIDGKGKINIAVGRQTLADSEIENGYIGKRQSGGQFVYIEVADSGHGIPEGEVPQIFEPFFTGNKTGRGLGLAVVFGNVNRHDGLIHCVSQKGQGTCFRILLPATESTPLPKIVRPPIQLPQELSIVVIDDQPVILESVTNMLQGKGWDIKTFDSPDQGLVFLDYHLESTDLLLMDVVMPGIDGIQILRELAANGATIPVIMMSGYSKVSFDELKECYSGVQAVLEKPFSAEQLHDAISLLQRVASSAA